jgi:hypothetical protein
MTLEDRIQEVLAPLVAEVRERSFSPGNEVSDARVVGTIVSKFLGWDGHAVLEAAVEALTDSNFHGEAAQVQAIIGAAV